MHQRMRETAGGIGRSTSTDDRDQPHRAIGRELPAFDREAHLSGSAGTEPDPCKWHPNGADTAVEAVPAVREDHGLIDHPRGAPGSAGGLHRGHFRREIGFRNLDTFSEGVAGEATHLHVLTDLARGLLDQFGDGD